MTEETAPKKRSWAKVGCLGLVGVIVLLAIIVAIAPEPTPEQLAVREAEQASERQAKSQLALDEALSVTSRDLAAAFEANEVAAQQTYGDRPLLVTGRVTGISLDFMDNPVVQLNGVNQFLDAQADLKDKAVAAGLQKGQEVTLLCQELSEVISAPMLGNCELIEH